MLRWLILLATHGAALAVGFALGVYTLPILTAPPAPAKAELQSVASQALYKARFVRELKGSDLLHWGEGDLKVGSSRIAFEGKLAPGPDYKLYLTKSFVDTKEGFDAIKSQSVRLGDIKSFDGFIVDVPSGIDVSAYTSAVVWCESFGAFITAAKYK